MLAKVFLNSDLLDRVENNIRARAYVKIEVHGGEVCPSGLVNGIVRSLTDIGLVRESVSQQWGEQYGIYMIVCSLVRVKLPSSRILRSVKNSFISIDPCSRAIRRLSAPSAYIAANMYIRVKRSDRSIKPSAVPIWVM
jgi:hypothetical protein